MMLSLWLLLLLPLQLLLLLLIPYKVTTNFHFKDEQHFFQKLRFTFADRPLRLVLQKHPPKALGTNSIKL